MGRVRLVLPLTAGLILTACGGGGGDAGKQLAEPDACGKRLPLVIDLPGYSETAALHEQRVGWTAFAELRGFEVVTPQADGDPPSWDLERDVAVVEAIIDEAVDDRCIDPDRVYVTGHSQGGMLTSRVACELADRVAAVALVSGMRPVEPCAPERPVPALVIHGTADATVPYAGGLPADVAALLELPEDGPSVPAMTEAWAERNGCAAGDAPLTWDCPEGADVELQPIEGWGHDWPTGAVEDIWAFFDRHRL